MKKAVHPLALSVIFISLLQSCNVGNQKPESPLTCESITGMWYGTNENVGMKITKDSIFWYAYKFREKPMIADSYTCDMIGDSVEITGISSQLRNIFYRQDNRVIMLNYKGGRYRDHVAVAIEMVKNKETQKHTPPITTKPDMFILPEGFTGVFAVAFNQNEGMDATFDETGNRIFEFSDPESFFMKTKAVESNFNIATLNMKILSKDAQGRLSEIRLVDRYSPQQPGFDITGIWAICYGINRVGRPIIDRIAGEKINGNIAFFEVGQPKSNHFTNDSILHRAEYHYFLSSVFLD